MIKYSRIKKIHFVGIGGAGMSGIAEVLNNMGFTVSGSDIAESEVVKRLKRMGVAVCLGHAAANVNDAETLVYSSAVTPDNEEVKEAMRRKIPVIPRAEMLAELMRLKFSIAVAGTHGKTTTTSMIAAILSHANLDPTFVVGGKLSTGESGAKLGASDYLVAEADESDGSFLRLLPSLAVITNIEDDHLDYYGNMDNLITAFKEFGDKAPFYGSIILNLDCPISEGIIPRLNKRVITTSCRREALFRAVNIVNSLFGLQFDLFVAGKMLSPIQLNIGGLHNASNALQAIAAAMEIGIDIETIKEGLLRFYLPERRFQVLYFNKSDNIMVMDDYAHHPTEIEATLAALKTGEFRRIIAVFQPHRFTRLGLLMDRFSTCFGHADKLIIAPIYSANQSSIENVDSRALLERIHAAGHKDASYIDSFGGICAFLEKELTKNDVAVFLSAGNLTRTAHDFAAQLEALRK